MISNSMNPIPTPPVHNKTHLLSVHTRLAQLPDLFRECTNPFKPRHFPLSPRFHQPNPQRPLLALRLPTPRPHPQGQVLLYICRFLPPLAQLGGLTSTAPDAFYRQLETLGLSLRVESGLKDTIAKHFTSGTKRWDESKFTHTVDTFNGVETRGCGGCGGRRWGRRCVSWRNVCRRWAADEV